MTEVTPELEAARKEYEQKRGKPVPNNKKNVLEWIEAQNAEITVDDSQEALPPKTAKQEQVDAAPIELKEIGEKLKKKGKLGNFYSGEWKMNITADEITYSINK